MLVASAPLPDPNPLVLGGNGCDEYPTQTLMYLWFISLHCFIKQWLMCGLDADPIWRNPSLNYNHEIGPKKGNFKILSLRLPSEPIWHESISGWQKSSCTTKILFAKLTVAEFFVLVFDKIFFSIDMFLEFLIYNNILSLGTSKTQITSFLVLPDSLFLLKGEVNGVTSLGKHHLHESLLFVCMHTYMLLEQVESWLCFLCWMVSYHREVNLERLNWVKNVQ